MLKLSSHLSNYRTRILFSCVDDFSAVPFNGLVFQHYRKLTMAPKKSKRSASDDSSSDSGPDDRNPPPKKSKPTDKGSSKKTNSNEEEHSFALDKNRFVKVRDFRGKLFIDIREFYEKDGQMLPGKKGISLNVSQWNKLKEQIDDIQESVEKMG